MEKKMNCICAICVKCGKLMTLNELASQWPTLCSVCWKELCEIRKEWLKDGC